MKTIKVGFALIIFFSLLACVETNFPTLRINPPNSNSGTNTPQPSPSPTPPTPPENKYFGYYAGAMEGVGTGNYISEMPEFANFVFIHSGNLEVRLEEAKSKGLKAMVSASWVFLDEHFKLRSNYKTLFEQQIEPAVKKYQDIIIAFYSQDEPYMNGLEHTPQVSIEEMNTQLETMGSFMKSKFPQIPIAVIFATKALYDPALLKKIVLPPSHDWFGMDCYDSFLWCGKKSIPQGYDIIKDLMTKATNLDGKKRWLMAVPPSGHPMRDSTFTLHDEDGVLSQLSDYKKFVASEPLFKVVIPFIWQSFNEWKGTRDLPRAKAEYQKFFQEFTN